MSARRWLGAAASAALVAVCAWVLPRTAGAAFADELGGVKGSVNSAKVGTSGATSEKELVVYLVPKQPVKLTPPSAPVIVSQKQLNFLPHVLPVIKGTKVQFKNEDPVKHNVLCKDGAYKIDSDVDANASCERVYDTPGVSQIGCRLHPDMGLYVIVLETPWFTTATIKKDEVDGKKVYLADFELKGVPPGEYTLKTWNKKLAETSRDVVVEAGKTLTVDLALEK